jgi:hypothetical protein
MEVVKCPVCGKSFIPAPEHIYKAWIKGKAKPLCGWNCLRKLERAIEAKKEAKKRAKEAKKNENR